MRSGMPGPKVLTYTSNMPRATCAFLSVTTAAGLTAMCLNPAATGTGGCPACVSGQRESVRDLESSAGWEVERKWNFRFPVRLLLNPVLPVQRPNGDWADDMREATIEAPNEKWDR